jgi:hypothetical protein
MATRPHRPEALSLFRGILCAALELAPRPGKEHGRVKFCSALLILCLCSAQCGHQALTDAKMTDAKPEITPPATGVSLDVTPMTDPLSTFVLVGQDNQARAVRYARSQLEVVAVYEGVLSGAHVSQLLARTGEPAFAEALRRRNFGGDGLRSGDQFYLSTKSQKSGGGECFGFIEDAPVSVRDLIKDLLALKTQLKEAALSDAYLRGEPIAAERFAALQRRGQLRFEAVSEFPPDTQPILTGAVTRPRDFLPINRAQYEQLLPHASHGHEFFLTADGSGYQLTLFKARDANAPPAKGDK